MFQNETKENMKKVVGNATESLKNDLKEVKPSMAKNPAVLLILVIAGMALSREMSLIFPAIMVVGAYVLIRSNKPTDLAKVAIQVPADVAGAVRDKIKSKKQQGEQPNSQAKPQEIASPDKQ